jgi:arylsulfatase A-like enzyme
MRISDTQSRTASPAPISPAVLLWLSVGAGMLTGWATVAGYAVSKLALHRYLHVNVHLAWMAPLGNGLIFALAGVLLIGLSLLVPRRMLFPVSVALLVWLSVFSISYRITGLHRGAAALLAAGVGLQIARIAAPRAAAFLRWARRATLALALLTLVTAAAMFVWRGAIERRSLAGLHDASGKPNVLFIVLDTVRSMSLSLYGFERPTTPQLERLAREGLRFERALSSATWTLTSHSSMMTGHWPHELSSSWKRPLDRTYPTLAEVLAARGYRTAGFVANTYYCSYESGLNRGFQHYEDFPVSLSEVIRSTDFGLRVTNAEWFLELVDRRQKTGRLSAADINREFLDWLPEADGRPYFAFLNFYDAHAAYHAPAPFDSLFYGGHERRNFDLGPEKEWTPEEIDAHRRAYEGAIAYLDHELGKLFDELRRRGDWNNTLVIVTSDHGEEFKEHGVMGHGNSLYRTAAQVPLLVLLPGRGMAGSTVPTLASTRNIPATVADLLDLENAPFPGQSLAAHWAPGQDELTPTGDTILTEVGYAWFQPPAYPVSNGPLRSMVAHGFRYIVNAKGKEELYDFERDSLERFNLVASPDLAPVVGDMRHAIGELSHGGVSDGEGED